MKAVVLDRDGVLNADSADFIKSWSEFTWMPGAREALRLLAGDGWRLFVVSNQSGINRGITAEAAVLDIHERMREDLKAYSVALDAVYYCPHRPDEGCNCRKPRQGMFLKLLAEFPVEPGRSWMIGDKLSDLIPAAQLGFGAILLRSPFREVPKNFDFEYSVRNDLLDAANYILRQDSR